MMIMNIRRLQKGVTMWGLLTGAGLVIFFALLAMKLVPGVIDGFKVKTALEKLSRQPGIGSKSKTQIANALDKYFEIDEVRSVNLQTDLIVQHRGRVTVITVDYEYEEPMIYNMYVVFKHQHSVEVFGGG
jgi:ribosomal protein L23